MKITSSKGKGTKIHISIDGEYALTVDADYWYSSGYSYREDITEEEFEELKEKIGCRRAYNKALTLLTSRDHSRQELKRKLLRSFDENAVEAALDRVQELNLINDERFALAFANELYNKKKMSVFAISRELYAKGIDRDIIDEVVSSFDTDPVADIEEIVNAKYIDKLGDEKGFRRTYNALVRLGYKHSDIMKVLNSLSDKGGYY